MSDIVERLRMKFPGAYLGAGQYEAVDATPLATKATDEIERLRKERSELREALEALVNGCVRYDENPESAVARAAYDAGLGVARAALSKAQGGEGSMSEWRDISTAPRDGTKFIGGQWIIEDGEPLFEQEVIWWSPSWGFAGGGYVQKPTLWMPLPSPPARTQGE